MSQPRHPAELNPKREPQRRLALKPYARSVAQVLRVSFRASPGAVLMKVAGSLISAVLPLVTTYFAGLTTTALGGAYSGGAGAGPVLGCVRQRGPLHPAGHELPRGGHSGRPDVRAVPGAGLLAVRRQRDRGPLRPRQAVLRLLCQGPGPDRGHLHAAGVGGAGHRRAAAGELVDRSDRAGRNRPQRLPAIQAVPRADRTLEHPGGFTAAAAGDLE